MLNKPDVPMYILLAKAQMKAKRNKVKNVSVMFTKPIHGIVILCLELQLICTFFNKINHAIHLLILLLINI